MLPSDILVKARRDDLVGEINKGWSIGKRLLQYERSGIGGLAGASKKKDKKVPPTGYFSGLFSVFGYGGANAEREDSVSR